MITNLLTKYILAPTWARILIFITFYFIIREFHLLNLDFQYAECMMPSRPCNKWAEHLDSVRDQVEKRSFDLSKNHLSWYQQDATIDEKDNFMREIAFYLPKRYIENADTIARYRFDNNSIVPNATNALINIVYPSLQDYIDNVLEVKKHNKELQQALALSNSRISDLEAQNLALTQKLTIEPREHAIERLQKQIQSLHVYQSNHISNVEEKLSETSEKNAKQLSEAIHPLITRSEIEVTPSFYKTKLINVLNEKQEVLNRLVIAEEQIAKLTKENLENTVSFRQQSNSMMRTILGLHQENQELHSQLKDFKNKIRELSRDRFPGAQRTNPFTTLRK